MNSETLPIDEPIVDEPNGSIDADDDEMKAYMELFNQEVNDQFVSIRVRSRSSCSAFFLVQYFEIQDFDYFWRRKILRNWELKMGIIDETMDIDETYQSEFIQGSLNIDI